MHSVLPLFGISSRGPCCAVLWSYLCHRKLDPCIISWRTPIAVDALMWPWENLFYLLRILRRQQADWPLPICPHSTSEGFVGQNSWRPLRCVDLGHGSGCDHSSLVIQLLVRHCGVGLCQVVSNGIVFLVKQGGEQLQPLLRQGRQIQGAIKDICQANYLRHFPGDSPVELPLSQSLDGVCMVGRPGRLCKIKKITLKASSTAPPLVC